MQKSVNVSLNLAKRFILTVVGDLSLAIDKKISEGLRDSDSKSVEETYKKTSQELEENKGSVLFQSFLSPPRRSQSDNQWFMSKSNEAGARMAITLYNSFIEIGRVKHKCQICTRDVNDQEYKTLVATVRPHPFTSMRPLLSDYYYR